MEERTKNKIKPILKWGTYTVVFTILSILQFTPYLFPRILDVRPAFIVTAVICMAMYEGDTAGAVFGAVFGLVWDCLSSRPSAFYALVIMIIGFAVGMLLKQTVRNNFVSALAIGVLSNLLVLILRWFIYGFMWDPKTATHSLLHLVLPCFVYSIIFILPIYILFFYLFKAFADDTRPFVKEMKLKNEFFKGDRENPFPDAR